MWQENEIYTELVEAFKLFNIVNPISQKEKKFLMRYKTTMLLGILGFGGYHLRLYLNLIILRIMMASAI